MSKKKKKKLKLAKKSVKILQSGKIKISKDQKIDITDLTADSIDNAVVSRLDGIISKEDVVINASDMKVDAGINLLTVSESMDHMAKINSDKTNTIVIVVPKKAALSCFDFSFSTDLGEILRRSTLAPVYKHLKEEWVKLNENDTSNFTNVMYVPGVTVFLDEYGNFMPYKYKINVLVLTIPNKKYMTENPVEEIDADSIRRRVVADILDSAIKCGCKHLIVDPHCYPVLRKDNDHTTALWKECLHTQRVIEQVRSLTFAIDNEDLYYKFHFVIED